MFKIVFKIEIIELVSWSLTSLFSRNHWNQFASISAMFRNSVVVSNHCDS